MLCIALHGETQPKMSGAATPAGQANENLISVCNNQNLNDELEISRSSV